MSNDIEQRVKKTIAENADDRGGVAERDELDNDEMNAINAADIKSDSRLYKDLKMSNQQFNDMVIELEREFKLTIDLNEATVDFTTVQSTIDWITAAIDYVAKEKAKRS